MSSREARRVSAALSRKIPVLVEEDTGDGSTGFGATTGRVTGGGVGFTFADSSSVSDSSSELDSSSDDSDSSFLAVGAAAAAG